MKFSLYQTSRQGSRSSNEDRMGYCYSDEAALLLLADGLGGHKDGDIAAQMSLQAMAQSFAEAATPRIDDPEEFLSHALLNAHAHLLHYAQKLQLNHVPRTTLVATLLQDDYALTIHCGDSRMYWWRGGERLFCTRDHSYTEYADEFEVVEESRMSRHVIFSCLGSTQTPRIDLSERMPLLAGDRLLLCSDGLWQAVMDDQLDSILNHQTIEYAVPEAVELALLNSGKRSDNVTALAVEWQS